MTVEFFKKAQNNLRAAQICFDNGLYDASVNRAYYAALQAAVAALASRGLKRAKADHKKIQADFSENLIRKQKIYPARVRSYLMDMQAVRNEADYTGLVISQRLSHKQIDKAAQLIALIRKELEPCA